MNGNDNEVKYICDATYCIKVVLYVGDVPRHMKCQGETAWQKKMCIKKGVGPCVFNECKAIELVDLVT